MYMKFCVCFPMHTTNRLGTGGIYIYMVHVSLWILSYKNVTCMINDVIHFLKLCNLHYITTLQVAGVTRTRGHDILLDYVAVEILSQIPWNYLKFQNVTGFRYFVLIVMFIMGIINVYSMWELCMGVRDFVLDRDFVWDHLNYIRMIIVPLLCLAMFIVIFQTIILGESLHGHIITQLISLQQYAYQFKSSLFHWNVTGIFLTSTLGVALHWQ